MNNKKMKSNSWILVSNNSISALIEAKKFASELVEDDKNIDFYIRHNHTKLLIDELKELIIKGNELSTTSSYKVIIIEAADEMDSRTANVLLKALEEPIESTIWILCATNYFNLLPTIRSRCQTVFLQNNSDEEIRNKLVSWGINENKASSITKISLCNTMFAFLYALSDSFLNNRKAILDAILNSQSVFYASQISNLLESIVSEDLKNAEDFSGDENINAFYQEKVLAAKNSANDGKAATQGQKETNELEMLFSNFFLTEDFVDDKKSKETAEKRIARIKLNYYYFYTFIVLSLVKDAIKAKINECAELVNDDYKNAIMNFASAKSYDELVSIYEKIYLALNDLSTNVNKTLLFESIICEVL